MRVRSFNLASPEYILISGGISLVVLAALTSQSSQLIGGTGVQGHRLWSGQVSFCRRVSVVDPSSNEDVSPANV